MSRNACSFLFIWMLLASLIVFRQRQWQRDYGMGIGAGKEIVVEHQIKAMSFYCVLDSFGWEVRLDKRECLSLKSQALQIGDKLRLVDGCVIRPQTGQNYKKRSCSAKNIDVIKENNINGLSYWWWVRQMDFLRQKVVYNFRAYLPEPEASLLAGIVVGEQANLPVILKQSLQTTGTMHVVAASGYNVMVVVGLLLPILVRVAGRTRGAVLAGISVWLYVLLAGGSPPVVRAGMMAVVMLFGSISGREYWSRWSLIMVGGLLLIWKPWLLESVSFQLSMAATTGVIWGSRFFSSIIPKHLPLNHTITESIATTLSATIMVAPISLITFGSVSWWGLLVNPMVLWLIPPLMLLGSFMSLSVIIWSYSGIVWLWVVLPISRLFVVLIEFAGSFSSSQNITINWWMVWGWWLGWIGLWSVNKFSKES